MSGCGLLGPLNPFADPPGKGEKAEYGYRTAISLNAALERYRNSRGSYPQNLESLVPEFLDRIPDASGSKPVTFGYRPAKDLTGYTLEFSYVGPGENNCWYSPGVDWRCSGYY